MISRHVWLITISLWFLSLHASESPAKHASVCKSVAFVGACGPAAPEDERKCEADQKQAIPGVPVAKDAELNQQLRSMLKKRLAMEKNKFRSNSIPCIIYEQNEWPELIDAPWLRSWHCCQIDTNGSVRFWGQNESNKRWHLLTIAPQAHKSSIRSLAPGADVHDTLLALPSADLVERMGPNLFSPSKKTLAIEREEKIQLYDVATGTLRCTIAGTFLPFLVRDVSITCIHRVTGMQHLFAADTGKLISQSAGLLTLGKYNFMVARGSSEYACIVAAEPHTYVEWPRVIDWSRDGSEKYYGVDVWLWHSAVDHLLLVRYAFRGGIIRSEHPVISDDGRHVAFECYTGGALNHSSQLCIAEIPISKD